MFDLKWHWQCNGYYSTIIQNGFGLYVENEERERVGQRKKA